MLFNYIKIACRHLWRNKAFSAINIFGLAIGIACAGLIFLWVEDEVKFNDSHEKKDRLYLVRVNQQYDRFVLTHSSTPGPLAPAMQAEIPGVARACRTTEGQTSLLFTHGDKAMYANGKYVESSFFTMFTLPFVQGDAATAFRQLHSVVITESAAKKFFGNEPQVVGKTLRVDNKQDYMVSGVIKDLPQNSTVQFEWLSPFDVYYERSPWAHIWANGSISTFVELKHGASAALVNKALQNFIQQRAPASISHPFLFAMPNWHLYDQFENGKITGGGQIQYVRMFTLIAWIILIIACINFMNLSSARSEKRSKEVGVRKVLGAGKAKLTMQFMTEALITAIIAAIAAVVLMMLVMPLFNTIVQKQLTPNLQNPQHLAALGAITLLCGLVAGSYPSLYLSSFNPVFVLKGVKLKMGSAAIIRKGLVITQFSVSIILIISTLLVYQQIQHIKNRPLGFNKDNLLQVSVQGDMAHHFDVIRQNLLNTGVVQNAALSDHQTLYGGNNTDGMTWPGKPAGSKVLVSGRNITPGFFETSGLRIIEGRDLQLSDSVQADGSSKQINVLVTKSLAELMGGGQTLGKTMYNEGDPTTKLTVIGVVNDYVYGNMYGKPDPVIFMWLPAQYASVMYVRTKPAINPADGLKAIEAVVKQHNPGYPFQYRFVDEQFNQLFTGEVLVGQLSKIFAALAIIISCLGLFGLAAYTAERRIKEIGIRKVLGASVTGLAALLSKDFLKLVLISCGVSFPVAWLIMKSWLQNYEYRISISAWVFIAAGLMAFVIALITVSFQAIRAATSNPVDSLRSE